MGWSGILLREKKRDRRFQLQLCPFGCYRPSGRSRIVSRYGATFRRFISSLILPTLRVSVKVAGIFPPVILHAVRIDARGLR